jgi:starch synthase
VAPWARATASHVRSALVTLEAARHATADRRRRTEPATLWVADLDSDGHDEVILASDRLFVVISPQHGARVVAAYDLSEAGGRQIIGNPIDDWNWQEEINRWMETPANHPGAFTDCGYENARWQLIHARAAGGVACVRLRCVEVDSPLSGSVKEYRLTSAGRFEVAYELAFSPERFDVEIGLSPDYLRLLRQGRGAARAWGASRRRGASTGESTVWIELPDGEPVLWAATPARAAGHVLGLRVSAFRPTFRITMGTGVPAPEVDALVRQGRRQRARRELVLNEMEQRRFRAERKDM